MEKLHFNNIFQVHAAYRLKKPMCLTDRMNGGLTTPALSQVYFCIKASKDGATFASLCGRFQFFYTKHATVAVLMGLELVDDAEFVSKLKARHG